jgi:competence protein ComEC
VGFQLSVGACAGIAVLGGRLARSLPGPRPLADALSVTLAAQLGVAPMLVATFGGMPLAGIPANLLAGPLAGPVMVWGLSAGFLAGLVGGAVGSFLHWPTSLMVGWIAWVAHRAALLPLGEIHAVELTVIATGSLLALAADHVRFVGVRRGALALVVLGVAGPAVALRAPPPVHSAVAAGATLWRSGATVVEIDGRVDAGSLLEGLRRAGVADIDAVVARTNSSAVDASVDALRRRYSVRLLITPSPGATPIALGNLLVDIDAASGRATVALTNGLSPG